MRLILPFLFAAAILPAAPLSSNTFVSLSVPGSTGNSASFPGISPMIVLFPANPSFEGTWSTPALSPWQGTFSATGPFPSSGTVGVSLWDFTNLNAGYLPSGTYVRLGDVDQGTFEEIRLRAVDPSGNTILTPWLDDTVHLASNNSSDFATANMPLYRFDNGIYYFVGASTNTLMTVSLITNTLIYQVEVDKLSPTNGLGFAAPTSAVPEPATTALFGSSLLALCALLRRRR